MHTVFFNKDCPNYFHEINVPTETNGVHLRSFPLQKTNVGQKALSYAGPTL